MVDGFSFNYCIKRINGVLKYIYNGQYFNSYDEMTDFIFGRRDRNIRTTTTTLKPVKRIKIDTQKLNEQFLRQVNRVRKIHQVKELKLNKDAVDAAQKWAEKSAQENREMFDYDRKYVTSYQSFDIPDYKNAIKKWYEEEKQHNYDRDTYTNISKHFAMMVWKATTDMGCGFAQGAQKVFVVCKFGPSRDNEIGFKQNVLKPKSKKNI